MEQGNINPQLVVAALFALLLVAGVVECAILIPRGRRRREALATRELANIVEISRFTGGGGLCVFMLIVTLCGSFYAYAASTTIFQQITAGVFWIGGTLLFGIGAVIGRRRDYTVYRSVHRTE